MVENNYIQEQGGSQIKQSNNENLVLLNNRKALYKYVNTLIYTEQGDICSSNLGILGQLAQKGAGIKT